MELNLLKETNEREEKDMAYNEIGEKILEELEGWAEFEDIHPDDFHDMWGHELEETLKNAGFTNLYNRIEAYIQDIAPTISISNLFVFEICDILNGEWEEDE